MNELPAVSVVTCKDGKIVVVNTTPAGRLMSIYERDPRSFTSWGEFGRGRMVIPVSITPVYGGKGPDGAESIVRVETRQAIPYGYRSFTEEVRSSESPAKIVATLEENGIKAPPIGRTQSRWAAIGERVRVAIGMDIEPGY